MPQEYRLQTALLTMGLLSALLGCGNAAWKEGGLYYTQNNDGSYSVVKILKIDELGVHVRHYSNQFPNPPTNVPENTLYLAGVDHKPGEQLAMGHLPLSKKSFERLKPVFFQQSKVSDEELEGYKIWLDEKGGYF